MFSTQISIFVRFYIKILEIITSLGPKLKQGKSWEILFTILFSLMTIIPFLSGADFVVLPRTALFIHEKTDKVSKSAFVKIKFLNFYQSKNSCVTSFC